MTGSFAYDLFLSHNSRDKPRVRKLAERLKKAGLQVWFDEWVVKPGDDIYLTIERGLAAARVQVLCLSPAALGSDWVSLERSTVLFRDPTNEGRRFVPLLLADCTLPDTLLRYKYVDFRQETSAAFDELLAACRENAEAPKALKPEPKKKRSRRKTKAEKPPEQAEPLVVRECTLTGHEGWINSVAISPNGKWAASGSDDQTVKIWDLETGKCRTTLEGHTDIVRSVAITPDGKRILSGSNDQSVRVWDAGSGRKLAELHGHTDVILTVVAFQDNARALSVGVDKTLRLWDLASGKCLKTIMCGTGDTDYVLSIAVNEAGTQALLGHADGRVRIWNLETGECQALLKGHSSPAYSIQTTSDWRFAISGSGDKTVKIWDLEAGTCIGTLEGHQYKVHSVAISPDGTLIASTGFIDHTVRSGIGNRERARRLLKITIT